MVLRHIPLLILLLSLLTIIGCSDHSLEVSAWLPGGEVSAWPSSEPEAQGMDPLILDTLVQRIGKGEYGQIHSLLVLRHGYLVTEEYFGGCGRTTLHPIYSVTKSVSSCLIGIAVDQGKIQNLDMPLLPFFPGYSSIANMDSNKRMITLEHVLTMKTGFQWDEASVPYHDPRNSAMQMASSRDWIKFVLDRPMSDRPGQRFCYNSGCSVLLSGIIMQSTGMSAREFADVYLFQLLGITEYTWDTGPNSVLNTGGGLSMRPEDLVKIGYLILKGGSWEGKQMISNSWVKGATKTHTVAFNSFHYGYQWWLMPLEGVEGHIPKPGDVIFAWGWGDQFMFVIPVLDMVVVSTAGNGLGSLQNVTIGLLKRYIIPAVRG